MATPDIGINYDDITTASGLLTTAANDTIAPELTTLYNSVHNLLQNGGGLYMIQTSPAIQAQYEQFNSSALQCVEAIKSFAKMFSDLVAKCEQAGGVDTDAVPLHFPPQGPFDFGCGAPPAPPPDEIELGGGNGIRSIASPSTISDSGWMQSHALDTALHLPFDAARATWSVRFSSTAVSGTYRYMCQVHGDAMEGFIHIN